MRHVRATIVAVESSKYYIFWGCVCSLMYPAYNAHASHYHLWPAWLYNIFSHHLIKGTIFKKNYWLWNMCFYFLYNFCPKHFSFEDECSEIWSRIYIDLHVKDFLFLTDFNEIGIFSTDFPKKAKYQISRKRVLWEPSSMRKDGWTDGRTERHDEPNSRLSRFFERA